MNNEKHNSKRNSVRIYWFAVLGIASLWLCGCSRRAEPTVVKGVISSVSYKNGDGKTQGFTRLNIAQAVPGGTGSWNIDAYGKLTRDFLIITRPQRKDLGPLVIPVRNLIEVQFGDAGIQHVDENQSAAPITR